MTEIILPGDKRSLKTNPDLELSKLLDDSGFSLEQTVFEMKQLMEDAKEKNTVEDRKLRRELIRDAQALHGSKASMKSINLGVFIHAPAGSKLNY